jgi:hypothetical protein
MGALKYNLKKLELPDKNARAKLLESNFISIDPSDISREISMVRSLRQNLNRYVYHTSLNFPNEDQAQLSDDKLLTIALDYLNAYGFTNNQYMIFRHHDSDHPHLHLLVTRISFDGTVVSDSNNYRKSEKILRELEYRYNLVSVEQSNFKTVEQSSGIAKDRDNVITRYPNNRRSTEQSSNRSRRPPTRNEVGMMVRTGKSSNKLLLQELLLILIRQKPTSITDLIRQGEKYGINFLFNQASTGRVFGITYFFKDFRAKGQALGNQFKWAKLIKNVSYTESDNIAIAEANKRTLAIYDITPIAVVTKNNCEGLHNPSEKYGEYHFENDTVSSNIVNEKIGLAENSANLHVDITDDVDDEAIHRKRRYRGNVR